MDCDGADEPALLRGPQHKKGWIDELASFKYDEAFDNFLLGYGSTTRRPS